MTAGIVRQISKCALTAGLGLAALGSIFAVQATIEIYVWRLPL